MRRLQQDGGPIAYPSGHRIADDAEMPIGAVFLSKPYDYAMLAATLCGLDCPPHRSSSTSGLGHAASVNMRPLRPSATSSGWLAAELLKV